MKAFCLWLAITLTVFSGLGGGYHIYLSRSPRKVLIAVDSSYDMKSVWSQVQPELEKISRQRYSRFCLVTEKNKIHSWTSHPDIGKTMPYAPGDFSKLIGKDKFPEIGEARKLFLITGAAQKQRFDGWEVIQLKP